MKEPWWARYRIIHFLIVAFDLLGKVIKKGADIGDIVQAIRISWKLTEHRD